ncbi:MAG: shikimate dehydrogenase [Nitrospirota bacterium]|jgi:shikimate dehydrogenase
MKIDAKTKLVALLGHPVGHSFSPLMHNAAFEDLGLNYRYVAFDVMPDNLGEAVAGVRALGLAGVNVTVPHKENVIQYLDEVSSEASFIGAVNTVVNENGRLKGYNTDGRGFMRSLEEEGISAEGARVLICGAGGAARAVGYYLSEKASLVTLFDVVREKAEALSAVLCKRGNVACVESLEKALPAADIVINATPIGLKEGDPLPFDLSAVGPEKVVGDLIYRETPLLREAASKGCRVFNGLGMLIWQGALAFELWTGEPPPYKIMRKTLESK